MLQHWEYKDDAIAAVKKQHGIDASRYDYREIFIPHDINGDDNGCTPWGAQADVGNGHPSRIPNPGASNALYRQGGPFVRAHELGHNFGLLHAGGQGHTRDGHLTGGWLEYAHLDLTLPKALASDAPRT